MRLEIQFERISKNRMIPIDYQYYISAWVYNVLKQGNKEFSQFLHQLGFSTDNKRFKFFCYSPLIVFRPKLWKEKNLLEIKAKELKLRVSFQIPDAMQYFVQGLFAGQEFYIGDKFNGIDLKVKSVQCLAQPEFNRIQSYVLTSPTVISLQTENDKCAKYLSPTHNEYKRLFINNLLEKYRVWSNISNTEPEEITSDQIIIEFGNEIKLMGKFIKPYTPQCTKIIGYKYKLKLDAPADIHNLAWNCGFGEKNSQGFGWSEII
ncbi:MAG: CRISPR-associated endoribonuclease Cas6 [Bacteroidales bacterium]|nr:CRISPR-associated endoribonuclease Cas6 [Bacteroidales bacterium]